MRQFTTGSLIAALLLSLTPMAVAEEGVQVPDVVGKRVEEATRLLESKGLIVDHVPVAGPAVDVIATQDPEPGVKMPRGSYVTLRFGIKSRVETRVPSVAGRKIGEALDELAPAYDLLVVPVPGSKVAQGLVIRTEPAAGQKLWFRGSLTVYVSDNGVRDGVRPDPATDDLGPPPTGSTPPIVVPPVPDVRPAPTVQPLPPVLPPPPGRGTTDDLAPPGARRTTPSDPGLPPPTVRAGTMPRVTGMTYADAQRTLVDAGLIPHPWFFRTGAAGWEVYTQKLRVGQPVSPGTVAHFRVVLPNPMPASVPTPSIVGLDLGSAIRIAGDLDLKVRVRSTSNVSSPDSIVRAQEPAPFGQLARGGTMTMILDVSGAPVDPRGTPMDPGLPPTLPPGSAPNLPPPDAIATGPVSPNVVGLGTAEAQRAIAEAGLRSELVPTRAAYAAPDRVFEQEPPAGLPVEGGVVRLVVPDGTTPPAAGAAYAKVPDVVNRSPADAEAVINATGLRAIVERGPEAAGVASIVIAQSHHPGALIAKGTLVTIVTGAPDGASVVTPPPAAKKKRGPIEKVGRFFRKKHKKAWGKVKDLFK